MQMGHPHTGDCNAMIHHCNFRKTICMFSKWLGSGQPCSWVTVPHIKCLHFWWWCRKISKGLRQCPSFWSHSYLCVPNSNDVDSHIKICVKHYLSDVCVPKASYINICCHITIPHTREFDIKRPMTFFALLCRINILLNHRDIGNLDGI